LCGDFADPHGTHIVCFNVVLEALKRIKASGELWINDCWLWLIKGAWQEWNIEEIEMAIPMSPDQVLKNDSAYSSSIAKRLGAFPGKRCKRILAAGRREKCGYGYRLC